MMYVLPTHLYHPINNRFHSIDMSVIICRLKLHHFTLQQDAVTPQLSLFLSRLELILIVWNIEFGYADFMPHVYNNVVQICTCKWFACMYYCS